ncbi:MAG: acyl carrier protein [Alphaproteobacteria bacterium]|nr:acyl carrier protein [Alphaproteobacteria bacterium]
MTEIDSSTTKEEILSHIKHIFIENFDLEDDAIVADAKLYDDLDIDSIDAVDLMVALKKKTGRKLDPDAFKQVRTVGDVVDAVHDLLIQ